MYAEVGKPLNITGCVGSETLTPVYIQNNNEHNVLVIGRMDDGNEEPVIATYDDHYMCWNTYPIRDGMFSIMAGLENGCL